MNIKPLQFITVTIEAKAALDALPKYIKRAAFLREYRLIDGNMTTIGFRIGTTQRPHHHVHLRSIRIINLCNAFEEYNRPVRKIKFHEL